MTSKIFCRNRLTADKIFMETSKWLKDRLKLEISAEKSTITNLRKKWSPFLGVRFPVRKRGKRFVCESRVGREALENMKTQLKGLIKRIQKKPGFHSVTRYNSVVLGFQEYYKVATHCTIDFAWLGWILKRSLYNRLKRFTFHEGFLSKTFSKKYRRKSEKIFIAGIPLFPIEDIRYQSPMCFSLDLMPYTEEGRKKIHKNLRENLQQTVRIISTQPESEKSIEYNDNRLSRWVASGGKCAVIGEFMSTNFHCHHKIQRSFGRTDAYENLVILSPDMHKLVHAKDPLLISNLLEWHDINNKQREKLNKLRELVGNERI